MIDIVETLTFSIVMLFFVAFPAIKIVEFFETKSVFVKKYKNGLIIVTIITLSLFVGLFLRYFEF